MGNSIVASIASPGSGHPIPEKRKSCLKTMSLPSHRRQSDLLSRVLFHAILLIAVGLLTSLLIHDPQARTAFADAFAVLVDGLVVVVLLAAAWKTGTHSRRLRWAWGLIALAYLSFCLGDIAWLILEVGLQQQPFPSIADGFFLAFGPVLLLGVLLMAKKGSRLGRINTVIDGSIVMLVGFLGYYNLLIGPSRTAAHGLPALNQPLLALFLLDDMVIFAALLILIYRPTDQQDERTRYLLSASLIVRIIADTLYVSHRLAGGYISGGPLAFVWIAGTLFAGLAGVAQWVSLQPNLDRNKRLPIVEFLQKLRSLSPFLPLVCLAFALLLLIDGELTHLPMSNLILSYFVAGLVVLAIVRQVFALIENTRLNRGLKRANQQLENEIAERERIQVQLTYDNMHDALTGLANRVLFLDRLGRAIEYSKRSEQVQFAVLFIDLDKFKVVNDSLGHLVGDQLLNQAARRLEGCLRTSDTVARFGGDEFEVLLEVTAGEASVLTVAEKIRRVLLPPFPIMGREMYVSASIGIIPNLRGYACAEEVQRDADIAMYQAKLIGGDRAEVFNLGMRQRAYARLELENELRAGLEAQEFELYYQPIRSLDQDRLISLEALLRWQHPQRGLLLPDDFLPTAEDSGLILLLGSWVLQTACAQMKAWQEKYPALRHTSVSVNIASKQLAQPGFFDQVRATLASSGLAPEHLKLEITENVLINNYAAAAEIFIKFKTLGVELQLDDFGTGYSALAYLQYFPIDSIKIDKTFIGAMNVDHRGSSLVRALISLARELGLATIAEGIETQTQLAELQSLSCGYGQGYLLSKPLAPGAAEAYLADQPAG